MNSSSAMTVVSPSSKIVIFVASALAICEHMDRVETQHVIEYGVNVAEPSVIVWEYAFVCPHIKERVLDVFASSSPLILDVIRSYLGKCEIRKTALNTMVLDFSQKTQKDKMLKVAA